MRRRVSVGDGLPERLLRIVPADWLPQGDLPEWEWWSHAYSQWDGAWLELLHSRGMPEPLRQRWLAVDRSECFRRMSAPFDPSII